MTLRNLAAVLLAITVTQTAFGLNQAKFADMDRAMEQAIESKRMPGGVLWVEHSGDVYRKAFGKRALVPSEEKMTPDPLLTSVLLLPLPPSLKNQSQ